MAGVIGYNHNCLEEKIEKKNYKCTLRESGFSDIECRILWDFYVSRSFAASSGMSIDLTEYGWRLTQNKTDGLPALEQKLADAAGIKTFCIVRSKTIKDTLIQMGLAQDKICTVHPRAVLLQNFHVDVDENEKIKVSSDESRVHAIFRHVRNSFAHGNTYFFANGMCLLEDKDKKTITAEILVPGKVLLEWIAIIDKNKKFYS